MNNLISELIELQNGAYLLINLDGEVVAVSGNSEFNDGDHPPNCTAGYIIKLVEGYTSEEYPGELD